VAHLRDKLGTQAELARAATWIGDCEDIQRMALTACALGAFWAVRANYPMKEGTTQDFSGDRQTIEELLARTEGLFVNHSYK